MARSNGPIDQAGTQAPQWRYPTDQDAQTRPPVAQQQPGWPFQAAAGQPPTHPGQPAPQHAPQGYPQQPQSAHGAPAYGGHAAMFGAPSAQSHAQGRTQPVHSHAAHQPAPQPGFDRFTAPPQQAPQGYVQPAPQHPSAQLQQSYFAPEPQQRAPRPAAAPRADAYQPGAGYAQAADPRGQSPAPSDLRGPSYDQWPAAPDPRGYDLGSYMPATAPGHGQAPNQGYPQHPQAYQQAVAATQHPGAPQSLEQWSGHDAYAQHPHDQAQGYDQGYAPQAGQGQLQHSADQAYQPEFEDEEVDEPKSGRRGLMVVGALVGAIVLGGGLAFGYKSFLAPPQKTAGAPPTVKNQAAPAKTKPADPGGKQFANQDSKVLGRLNDDGDGTGVRKVATVQVGRDGSIAAPSATAPVQPQQATTGVPGLFLDTTGPRSALPAVPTQQAPGVAVAPPRQPVITAAVAEPPPVAQKRPIAPAATAAQPGGAAPAAAVAAKPAAKKPKVRDDLAAAGQTGAGAAGVTTAAVAAVPAALGAAKTSSGFVAVLASRPSQMDALKMIADLQQKFPTQLANKIVTVQETDLTAQGKGVVHRVIVGPPGSRELANELCGQIRTAGHKDCWLTSY